MTQSQNIKEQNSNWTEYDELGEKQNEKLYLTFLKIFYKHKNFHQMKIIQDSRMAHKMKIQRKKLGIEYLPGWGEFKGIMLVGINPSVRSKLRNVWEDPYGKYFSGFLKEAGIDYLEAFTTNLYKVPTPGNRPLNKKEIDIGWKELLYEIGYVDPKIIVALGSQVRKQFKVEVNEIKNWKNYRVYGLHHPSYIKKNPQCKEEFVENLKRINKIYERTKNPF